MSLKKGDIVVFKPEILSEEPEWNVSSGSIIQIEDDIDGYSFQCGKMKRISPPHRVRSVNWGFSGGCGVPFFEKVKLDA